METAKALSVLFVAVSVAFAAAAYSSLPDVIVTHWNAAGEPNGAMQKAFGLGVFPVLAVFLLILFRALPSIDPLNQGYKNFRAKYDWFVAGILAFIVLIELLVIAWNFGLQVGFGSLLSAAFAALLYGVGWLLSGVKRNWFVGIRTPWTLSSESVWDKTHALGGKLFKAAGVLMLAGVVVPQYAVGLVLALAVGPSALLVAYSYMEFRREQRGKRRALPGAS